MKSGYLDRKTCRVCGSADLNTILDFGEVFLTGVFLNNGLDVPKAPLKFGLCNECKLAQTLHTYDLDSLYTDSYGYESGLNQSMTQHLISKAKMLETKYLNKSQSIILEIASNDGTLLTGFTEGLHTLIGMDPLIDVVTDRYPEKVIKVKDFFSSKAYETVMAEPADLVISNSVFYDLDSPIIFAQEISNILKEGGIWHLEQSYMPSMVESLSFDTICHEHLLYLRLHDLMKVFEIVGLQIIDVSLNDVNGGSIAVSAIKSQKKIKKHPFLVFLLKKELDSGYVSGLRLEEFADKTHKHIKELSGFITSLKESKLDIFGLGASTKGNLLLQSLSIDFNWIEAIGDVNPRKFGKRTPGTNISICPETEILNRQYGNSVALVLPWHFKSGISKKATNYISSGNSLLFPLPKIELHGC